MLEPPKLNKSEKNKYFLKAEEDIKKRCPKIIHKKGDYLNKVFNFMLLDTYMQPHLHPGKEKTEKMHLISGSFVLILFSDNGKIKEKFNLNGFEKKYIEIPPFTWHTYLMTSQKVITFETMEGVYNPKTWKKMAPWAPSENSINALSYFNNLRNLIS